MIREYLNEPLEIGDVITFDGLIVIIDHFVEQGVMTKTEVKQIETHLPYYPGNPRSVSAARVDLRGWVSHGPSHTLSQITIRGGTVRKIKIEDLMAAALMNEDHRNEIIKTAMTLKRGEKIKRK